jgi:CarboxypepD_reg-like domain/TonB-dependent Receptor Plug Domain
MKKAISFLIIFVFCSLLVFAQKGIISGTIKDKVTQKQLSGASVTIENQAFADQSNADGRYEIKDIPVGSYNVKVTYQGYKTDVQYNIVVSSGATQFINFELDRSSTKVGEITVKGSRKASAVAADLITPLSVQRLSSTEIRSNPGGNFDISKVIQALPGVSGSTGGASFRNDIIIRGGAPNENVFFLDGMEIPVLNHFQTQGASGGPAGMLNVSFIEDVKLSSSAFDAKYDNAMASVFQFKQRDGNNKKFSGNIRLSGTEIAGTLEGPLSKNTTYLVSARRSYLQFLFKAIDIPIRPDFTDFQYKVTTKINPKTSISFLGLGAIDEFTTEATKTSTPENEYILRSVPFINQWNYTTGATLKRLVDDGFYTVSLSRNMFDNRIDQFEDKQQGNEAFRNLGLKSQEIENKLRFEYNKFVKGWRWSAGAMVQYVKFNNNLLSKVSILQPDSSGTLQAVRIPITYNTNINFFRYGAFGQLSRKFLDDKLGMTFGARTDMNTFTDNGANPLPALSPRFSVSYSIAPKWQISGSIGSYAKLPIYTALGYKDNAGNFANKKLDYIRSNHYVTGVEFLPKNDLRITAEVFYKQYSNYLVNQNTGISLANEGTDFLAIGNAPFDGNGKGRAYGFELFLQKKLTKTIFATTSYTYFHSQFSGANGKYIPSAWDNRHLFSGILGKKFKRNWEMGLKLRATGQSPYTPYDTAASRPQFVLNGRGVLDYDKLNTLRLSPFWQFDFRVDKKFNFKKRTLDIFLDVQNAFVTANEASPTFVFKRNDTNTGFTTTDGLPLQLNGGNGVPLLLPNDNGIPTPTIGFIFEF